MKNYQNAIYIVIQHMRICLEIVYLTQCHTSLNFESSSTLLKMNAPKVQQTRQFELNPEWLNDPHTHIYQ